MTNGDNKLFEFGIEDISTNLQYALDLLIKEVKDNEDVKKHLDSERGIDSSDDDFMYYFHHSLSFMIHEIFGINITNYAVFPNYECSAHEFFKKLSDPESRKEYFNKLSIIINSTKQKSTLPCQFAINVTNPYKLNSNYQYDLELQQKLNDFSSASQRLIELPSSNFSNFCSFFSGKLDFRRLDFNLPAVCIKSFFETLHKEMKIKGCLIKCPTQMPIKFLCNTTTIAYKKSTTTEYSPLDKDNFRKATTTSCGSRNINTIKNVISSIS